MVSGGFEQGGRWGGAVPAGGEGVERIVIGVSCGRALVLAGPGTRTGTDEFGNRSGAGGAVAGRGGVREPGVRPEDLGPAVREGTAWRRSAWCEWGRGGTSGVRSGPSRSRKDQPEAHSCMVAVEEPTAVREAQPRNSSGSLTS